MVIRMEIELKIRENETKEEYIDRICASKDLLKLKWDDIADIINSNTGMEYTESYYRKNYKKKQLEKVLSESVEDDNESTIDDKLFELKKLKYKISDERIQANAYIRRLSREETIKEIAYNVAKDFNSRILLDNVTPIAPDTEYGEAILCISDWHYGIECDNYWNTYSVEIAEKRINELKNQVACRLIERPVDCLHVVNLSDLICGRIHLKLRIESRFDVITQVLRVSEILAEMLNDLSKIVRIEYYDVLDNHSRIEPNKKDSLDLESLCRIIPWFLKERLKDNVNVNINNNEFSEDICTFECMGYKIAGVHGDKDSPKTAMTNINALTKRHFDLILTAHLHHFSADEQCDTIVVGNGTLMGTDSFAMSLRLNSKPSQNLIFVTRENVVDTIHRLVVE